MEAPYGVSDNSKEVPFRAASRSMGERNGSYDEIESAVVRARRVPRRTTGSMSCFTRTRSIDTRLGINDRMLLEHSSDEIGSYSVRTLYHVSTGRIDSLEPYTSCVHVPVANECTTTPPRLRIERIHERALAPASAGAPPVKAKRKRIQGCFGCVAGVKST